MKKHLSLLMLLAALIVPWASRAQSHNAIVGNWSATTSSAYGGFHNTSKYSWTQTLYPQSEMGGAGWIHAIILDNRSTASNDLDSAKIYLGHTTMTSHPTAAVSTWVPMADLSLVWSATTYTIPGEEDWLVIELDQPFYYNGTSTLAMVISKAAQATSSSTKFGYVSTTASMKYTGGTTESYCRFPTVAGTNSTYKENAIFVMTENQNDSYTLPLRGLHVTDATPGSATVAWLGEAGASYEVAYAEVGGTDNSTTISGTIVTDTFYSFSGLDLNTEYWMYVRKQAANGVYSAWDSVKVRTMMTPLNFPLTFDFDDPDDDDNYLIANATNGWYIDSLENRRAMYISDNNGATNSYTITTSGYSWAWVDVELTTAGVYEVGFDWRAQGEGNYDYLRIALASPGTMFSPVYADNPTATNFRTMLPEGWINLSTTTDGQYKLNLCNTWQHYGSEVTITDSMLGYYHLVFIWVNDASGGTTPPAAVDNFVMQLSTCLAPTAYTVSDITPNSATLNVTHPDATTFLAVYHKEGDNHWDTVEMSSSETFTDLVMGMSYSGYVYTLCGDETSVAGLPFTFTTGCGTLTEDDLPFIEDFEFYGTGASNPINTCWAKGTNGTTAYPYPYSTAAINGSRGLYFYGYYPSSSTGIFTYSWAALPPVDESLDISTLMVTFNAKRYATTTSYYNSYILVGIADSLTAFTSALGIDSTVTWIDTINLTSLPASTIEAEEVSFESYYGDGKYVVFYSPVPALSGSNTYAYNYIYIDDIALRAIPTCFWPTEVALDSVTAESAVISWTPDPRTTEPSGWNIEYGLHGFTLGEGETETVTDTTVELTNLLPNTAYDVYVSANCGGDESDPTMFTFRTACVALDSLPYTQDFEQETTNTSTTAWAVPCWGHLNNATTNFGYPYLSSSSTYNHTAGGTKGLYWYGSTTTGTYGDYYCLVLPSVDAELYPVNTLQVKFWAKSSSTSYNVQFQVGVMTDPNDINSFQLIENVVVGGNTTWEEYIVALGAYTGEGQYIAIKGVRPSSTWYAYMDDITIETMPPCPAITGIEATTTVGSALLNWEWQAGYEAPDNYVVTYDSVGGTNLTTLNVTTNSIVLTGLAAATGYKAYVWADCGADGMGLMDSVSFATGEFSCVLDPTTADTVSIGNGTSTTYYLPIGNFYHYSYTQQLIDATEMHGATELTGIDFQYAYATPMTSKTDVTIYMANTSATSLTSAFVSYDTSFHQVYHGPLNCTQGWNHFEFDTPFSYNGTSNLLIVVHDNSNAYNGNSYIFNSHSATGKGRYIQNDSNPYDITSPGTGTSYAYRANMKLYSGTCLYMATCAAPAVTIAEMDSADVTIAWVPGYDETSWDVSHRIAGDTAWITDASSVSTNSYTFTGLTPATEYEFRVSFLCSDGLEYSGVANVKTPCAPMPLPYTQNFDHLTTGTATSSLTVVPDCWEYELTGTSTYQGASYYPGVYYNASYAESGSYSYRLYGEGNHMLPEMSAPLDSLMLSFYDYTTSASYALSVGVMEDGMFIPIQSVSLTPNEHNYVEVTFSSYHGNSRTIALRNYYTSSGTYYSYHYIDDLRVEYIPECERPITIDVTALSFDQATIEWDSISDSYEVYYSTTPVNPDTVADATFISSVTNSITLTGLTQNTEYFVYVRTICGASTHSDWSNEFSFTTACAEQPLPYTENFESYGSSSTSPISPCWTKGTNNSTQYPYPSSTAINGSRSLYFYAYHPSSATSTPYFSYAALPMFQDSTNRLMISFNARRYSTASNLYTSRLVIGVMTNPNDISTFFPMDTLDLQATPASSVHGYEYCFNNYTGTGRYLALYNEVPPLYGSTYSYSYIYVDDILVDTIPSCMRPRNVSITGITQNSATVHWVAGENATSFEIEYGPSGFIHGLGTTVTSTLDSIDLTGLLASTQYDVYIRANCSATEQSEWSFVQNFATVCGPTALPMVFDPDNYSTGSSSPLPNCWTRTNNATGTTNYYPYIYSSSANAHTGTNTVYYYFSTTSGYANDEVMAFPEIDVTNFPMNTVEVSFWAKASTTGKHFLVGVMTDPTNINSFVTIDTIALTTTSAEYTVELGSYTGAGAYVALRGVMEGTSSYYIYVDDIYIGVMSHCPRVYDLTAYNGTATGATLEWTDTIGSTSWVIEYQQYGTTNATTVTATSNPYTLTGLTANTLYTYCVAPVCSDGTQADWSRESYTFSTSQVPATVPYTYNFEDGAEWANWQTLSNNTVKWSRGNVVGNPGYSMYLSTDNGVTRSMDMATITNSAVYRDFDFGATPVSYELSFDALVGGSTDGNYDGITVMVVDPAIVPEVSSTGLTSPWGHIGTVDVRMDTVWAGESVYLDGMQGVKRLVFFHFNQATATTHPYIDSPDAIDNIAIGLQPCARPYDLAANNVTDHSALLSWAGPSTDVYLVAHRVYGASATTNVFDTVIGTSFTLSGLNADEEYVFWVTHICSLTATDTLASDWSNGFRFTTECATHQLPFLETFDSVTPAAYNAAGELPDCWRAFSNGTNAVYMPHVVGSGSYYYYVTGNALTMTSGSETYGNTKIVALPPFNAPVSACGIRFHYRHENASNGTLEIGYVTSADLEATFHPLVALPGTTTMTQIDSTLLSGAPANATRIALRWIYTTSFYSVGIDNIEVWANELCPAPTATVSNIEAQSATVTVTGSGIAYELEYGTDNANLANTMTSTTGVFNLTGLQPETQYFYAVRQQCDSTLFSNWYNGSFTTDELGCLPPTNFAALNTDYTAATLGWTVGNEETAWEVHVFNLTFDTVLPASTTSITVNGLDNNTAFSAAVRALCGVDNDVQGPWSDTITFTTDSCYAVTNIQTNVTATTATISWTGTSASYRLAYMEPPFNMVDATQVTVNTNSYTITGLYAETQYVFVIVNNCAEGVNTATGVQTFTTLASGVEPTYYAITVVSNNPEWGTVTGGGNYQENATVTLTATANEGYHFEQWNDGVTTATRTITVTGDATYTAFFAEDGTVTTYYTVTVTSNNDAWGTVSGGGQYAEGSTATITATAASGYHFVEWNDGNTQNPRSFTVTADVAYEATFEADANGIGDVNAGALSLYPNPASTSVTLGLDGFEGEVNVEIVDMNGRVVYSASTTTSTIVVDVNDMPQGAYFVRVVSGTRTAVSKLIVK